MSLDHRGISGCACKEFCKGILSAEREKEGERGKKGREREQDNALNSSITPQRLSEFCHSLFRH